MHPTDGPPGDKVVSLSLIRSEKYDLRFTDILHKRRRPLLLLVDAEGNLQYSSLPDGARPAEHRLLGQAVAEAQVLLQGDANEIQKAGRKVASAEGQRAGLIMLDDLVYSVRIFPLHPARHDRRVGQRVVVIEPIAGPLTDGVNFSRIKSQFRLSNRELDVLVSLMTGTKDKQIARDLGVSAGTVRAYLKSVRAKLGVTTRTGIVNLVHEVSGTSAPAERA